MLKPNLNLPLASSYNERGMSGFTNTVTNRIDQQKINCFYDITKNSVTGAGKLDLTKRPGVTSGGTFGTSSQAAYAVIFPPGSGLGSNPWLFSRNGNDVRVSDTSTTKVIFSSGAVYYPIFVDKTLISGSENIVVQARTDLTTAQRVFFSSSSIAAAWTEITDGDFTGLVHVGKMEHMDGFAFIFETLNRIFNSDLNSLANWSATNFVTKQIKQDFPAGLARLNNQLIAFGYETMEVFYNAGNATGSPLSPIKQLHKRVGLGFYSSTNVQSSNYYAILLGKIYFVGRSAGGIHSIGAYSYDGSTVEKISTPAIDKILGQTPTNFSGVFSIGFQNKSAIAIQISQGLDTTQRWLMFFPDWKDWFEWNSTIFSPVNNGEYFLGVQPNQTQLYTFDGSDKWQDSNTNYTMSTQFKLPQDGHQRKRMAEFGVLADTARSSNMLSVEFSDDDYVSFINIGAIDLARDIKTLNRGGSYRQRAVRLSSTNALETRLSAFIARIE